MIDTLEEILAEEREALAEVQLLEQLVVDRKRQSGMQFYVPNLQQMNAHKSLAKTILYCGGNRAGKSTYGALELCFHLTRDYPDWYPQERRFKGPIKAVISATEFPIVTRVIEPKIVEYLPKNYYKMKRSPQGYLQRIVCTDGSTVDILTGEMKDEAYESADWDFGWLDEPQQQRKYQAIRRGLVDRDGLLAITFTPLTEPWMKEELVDKADGVQIDLFTVNIRDNRFDHQGNPILSEQAIQNFEAALPDDVKETRISGKFFHLRGAVYKEFGNEHTRSFVYDEKDNYPVICVLDPHDRTPHHLIWAYVDKNDDVWVDSEISIHQELPDLAKTIKKIEKDKRYNMRKRLIDPNFGRKPYSVGNNRSVIQELAKEGVSFYEGGDDKELGHMLVREALHYDSLRPVTALNQPKLFFSKERTPLTIKSMRNLQYEDWQGKTKDDKDLKETQKQKDTHGADCIRYLIMSKPMYDRVIQSTGLEGPAY